MKTDTKNLAYDDFTEAFLIFLQVNCVPVLCGGGEVGGYNPSFIDSEIRIKLTERGSGYIHLIGQDSQTVDFHTMDHFRSQDMITPQQREKISELTSARATKTVQLENKRLKQLVKELEDKIAKIKAL